MQKQTIPINKSTENKPIKMFVIVSSLDIYFRIIYHGFINKTSTL